MAQIFSRAADMWLRLGLLACFGGLALVFIVAAVLDRSDYLSGKDWTLRQPVPFSHAHHAGALQIDCRYCHTGVESSAVAGLPPTHTCMSCHSQLWTDAEMLAPVRQSLAEQRPLQWNRVAVLPDYVYFHHGVHVQAGVGCVECHGHVEEMPLMLRAETLSMGWCLDCHQDPAPRLRPPAAVTDMAWTTQRNRRELGEELLRRQHIDTGNLTHCYVCHR